MEEVSNAGAWYLLLDLGTAVGLCHEENAQVCPVVLHPRIQFRFFVISSFSGLHSLLRSVTSRDQILNVFSRFGHRTRSRESSVYGCNERTEAKLGAVPTTGIHTRAVIDKIYLLSLICVDLEKNLVDRILGWFGGEVYLTISHSNCIS